MEPGAVPKSPRGPLSATVQHPAWWLLSVQRSGRRLVSSEFGAALPVTMWGAGLSMQTVMAAGAWGQALGDVLCVGGRASLAGTSVENTAESRCQCYQENQLSFHVFRADGTASTASLQENQQCRIDVFWVLYMFKCFYSPTQCNSIFLWDDSGCWPSAGAGPLQLSRLSDQASLTADDPQFVLVGRGQVNGPGGDGWAQVARVGDVQVGQHCRTRSKTEMWTIELTCNISVIKCMVQCSLSVSPQSSVSLNFNDVQRVVVGDKQVGLSVGCTRKEEKSYIWCWLLF